MSNFKKNNSKLWIHFLCWSIFILYDAVLGGFVKGIFGSLSNYVVHYTYNISLFYINALIILPLAFKHSSKLLWLIPILIIIELSLYLLTVYSIDYFLIYYTSILSQKELHFNKIFILGFVWRGCYFLLFSTAYFFFMRYVKARDEKEEVLKHQNKAILKQEITEKQLVLAKNQFLLAQINPHFLFNTLNFIYYITLKDSSKGAQAIMLLSKIMRYSSDIENAIKLIPLSKEIEYVKTLIEIHQLRYGEKLYIEFSYEQKTEKVNIIPFTIITIAENLFKHGNVVNFDYPAKLKVFIDTKERLVITCTNKCKQLKQIENLKSGLNNLKERLFLTYNHHSNLNYHIDDDIFSLELNIDLKIIEKTTSNLENDQLKEDVLKSKYSISL